MTHLALITGSSDGLGKAFAIECARRGMDLLLVSLPNTGLPGLCRTIEENFPVRVNYLELDLTVESNCEKLVNYVQSTDLPISVLINNAGVGGNYDFAYEGFGTYDRMIRLNIKALTLITHGVLPILMRRKSAYILNVSSMIIHFAGPFKQVYGATKSFIYYFSKSLSIELANTRVKVSVLCPGGINSNIKAFRVNSNYNFLQTISLLYPEQVASYAIEKTMEGKEEIIPGSVVRIFYALSHLLPAQIKKWMTKSTIQRMLQSYKGLNIRTS